MAAVNIARLSFLGYRPHSQCGHLSRSFRLADVQGAERRRFVPPAGPAERPAAADRVIGPVDTVGCGRVRLRHREIHPLVAEIVIGEPSATQPGMAEMSQAGWPAASSRLQRSQTNAPEISLPLTTSTLSPACRYSSWLAMISASSSRPCVSQYRRGMASQWTLAVTGWVDSASSTRSASADIA